MISWDLKENNIKTINTTHLIRIKRENNLGECYPTWTVLFSVHDFAKKFMAF